eukprot:6209470-Amphidinium_carterae.1
MALALRCHLCTKVVPRGQAAIHGGPVGLPTDPKMQARSHSQYDVLASLVTGKALDIVKGSKHRETYRMALKVEIKLSMSTKYLATRGDFLKLHHP